MEGRARGREAGREGVAGGDKEDRSVLSKSKKPTLRVWGIKRIERDSFEF